MAAFIGRYVRDIPATSSGTVSSYFSHRAITKCSWAFWNTKTVKTMYIDNNGHITLWLTMIQRQQSLTLHWHSFSRWGREHVTVSFSYKGSQYFVYDCLQRVASRITHDTPPTMVDPHFQDGAGRVSQSAFPTKAARNSSMTVCNLSVVWSPRMQAQKSLTLCWHSS